jgi:hypothetical protein
MSEATPEETFIVAHSRSGGPCVPDGTADLLARRTADLRLPDELARKRWGQRRGVMKADTMSR